MFRTFIYLPGSGTVPDGSKHRVLIAGGRSWRGAGNGLDQNHNDPAVYATRMVHNIYRACRGSAGKSDRRSKRRSDTGKSDQTQLIYSYRHSHGYFHAESAHRHTYPVVPHTGLCHRIDPFVFRT